MVESENCNGFNSSLRLASHYYLKNFLKYLTSLQGTVDHKMKSNHVRLAKRSLNFWNHAINLIVLQTSNMLRASIVKTSQR